MRVDAVLLAAGRGARMGGPKALLAAGGETFLARCARVLDRPGVARVIAVLGHEAERVAREADRLAREARAGASLTWVVNPRHADGMLGSILAGLDVADADGADAVLVHPVDHPLVEPETVEAVVAALAERARIAVPSHDGRRGHPAGFARAAWDALRAARPEEGARGVLAGHPDWIVHVAGGPGCRAGINTPEDYRRLIGTDPASAPIDNR
jgi:molybdenum cofactor cytidylyltransferase